MKNVPGENVMLPANTVEKPLTVQQNVEQLKSLATGCQSKALEKARKATETIPRMLAVLKEQQETQQTRTVPSKKIIW